MLYTRKNLVRFMALATCGVALGACGAGDTGQPFTATYVYCDNPEAAAPSCSLSGFSMADDSALRTKLEGCTMSGCHGTSGPRETTWSLDLSGSVGDALSSLATFADGSSYFLVDDLDPDCSQLLTEVTSKPVGAVRMPVTGGFWSTAETDCFRSYLNELYPQ